ncbi:MAG: LysM repeat-containing protein [Sporanaerobacter sp.]|uniref:LysM peptidoglycan-binding domain-containing protein n=1 Tax=Sporanaerobacter sp. TaxID=2010183 RepID=UPI003A103059
MDNYEKQKSCPTGTFPYTIKAGDTFYKLSIRFNVPLDAILRANPGVDPNNLQIGQVVCIPLKSAPPVPPVPPCPGGFYYTIKAGDTFYKLSIRFNVPLDAILRANPGVDPNNLQIGQVVCIPSRPAPPIPPVPPCPGGFYYTIKAGDTLYSIAQMFNVSVQELMAANPGVDPNNLQIGQVICVPSRPVPPCPGGFYYTIKAGDTFYSIAQMFNVSVQELMAANPGVDPNNLQIGQVICVPRSIPWPWPRG